MYYGVVENIPNVNQVIILWGPVFSVVTGRALRDDTHACVWLALLTPRKAGDYS